MCLSLQALNYDGISIDKATQVTVDTMAIWATRVKKCIAQVGKGNFFISDEVAGGNTLGALYT